MDWTTVLVATVPAGITGLVGYGVAKTQAGVAAAGVRAETDRLLLTRKHNIVDALRVCYSDFLTAEEKLRNAADTMDALPFRAWYEDNVVSQASEVTLMGSDDVRARLGSVMEYYADVIDEAEALRHEPPPDVTTLAQIDARITDRIAEQLVDTADERAERRRALVDAMRADIQSRTVREEADSVATHTIPRWSWSHGGWH
jgi:hypothetical protein